MFEKYLVTGGSGPVGKLVTNVLLENGLNVRVLIGPEDSQAAYEGKNVEIFRGEIFDKDSLKDFFTLDNPRTACVIHTEEVVSISSQPNLNMRRINVSGSQNVVDQCIKYKIGKIVALGSAYALNPDNSTENAVLHFDRTKVEGDYARSKAEAGAYIVEKISLNRLNAVILLPTFIIGPGFPDDYEMNKILERFLESGVPTIKGGHAFVDIRDVANALVSLTENGQVGGCYILNGEYKSADDFFTVVSATSPKEVQVRKAPKWIMRRSLSRFADTYYRISKKDNPKEVYALFMNMPDQRFNSTVQDLLPAKEVIGIHDSLNYVLNGIEELMPKPAPAEEEKAPAETEAKTEDAAGAAEVTVPAEAGEPEVPEAAEEKAEAAVQKMEDIADTVAAEVPETADIPDVPDIPEAPEI